MFLFLYDSTKNSVIPSMHFKPTAFLLFISLFSCTGNKGPVRLRTVKNISQPHTIYCEDDLKLVLADDNTYRFHFINSRCSDDFVRYGTWSRSKDTIILTEARGTIPFMCMGATGGAKFFNTKQDGPVMVHHEDTLQWNGAKLVRQK